MTNKNFLEIKFALPSIDGAIYFTDYFWSEDSWEAKKECKKKYEDAFNIKVI